MVTLTCPFLPDIEVTKEHAERILASKINQNPTAQWAIKDTDGTIGTATNDGTDSGKTEAEQVEGKDRQGNKPRKSPTVTRDANPSGE